MLWSSGRVSFRSLNVLDLRAQSKQCRERPKGSANVSGSQCPSVNVNSVTSAYMETLFLFCLLFCVKGRGAWVPQPTRGCEGNFYHVGPGDQT